MAKCILNISLIFAVVCTVGFSAYLIIPLGFDPSSIASLLSFAVLFVFTVPALIAEVCLYSDLKYFILCSDKTTPRTVFHAATALAAVMLGITVPIAFVSTEYYGIAIVLMLYLSIGIVVSKAMGKIVSRRRPPQNKEE